MKNNNIDVFLDIVRAGLWEKEVRLEQYGKIDFEEIYRLAGEQSVVGLVTAGIERYKNLNVNLDPDQELLLQMIGEVQMIEQQNKAMNKFIEKLVGEMRQKGIYTLLVKGQGVAQSYERPLWRSSGDVDFFLSSENYNKAKEFLVSIAESVDTERGTHFGMTIDSWIVELHGRLNTGLSKRIDNVILEAQNDCFYNGSVRSWTNGNTQVFLPSIDNDIIFIFTHYLKHFYKGGLGLRQICDWCRLLWKFRSELDLRLLESRLNRMGLMSEWQAFAAFVVEYLGMPMEAMPLYVSSAKWKRKASLICNFVMEVGNMGHNRDMSYYGTKPYMLRKAMSMRQRVGDIIGHTRVFPLDSLRFFPRIMINGVRSAIKGY